MARSIELSFTGSDALQALFKRLPYALQSKYLRSAMRKAGKLVLGSSKAKVAVDTGALKKNIKLRAIKRNSKGIIGVRIATPSRADLGIDPKDKGYYPSVLEYGSKTLPARPYLRPSMEQNRGLCIEIIKDELRRAIEEEAKKSHGA